MSSERTPAGLASLDPDYEILREIGRGGTAVVYLARERATGAEVAIKLIRAKYLEDEEAIARFAREARFVAQLDHPNVVGVHAVLDLGSAGIALVMTHIAGRTLKQLIQERAATASELIK
jgi:serine/threonine protein kinase